MGWEETDYCQFNGLGVPCLYDNSTNTSKGSIIDAQSNLRRSILSISLPAMQQLTGINFIFYFGISFFQTLGIISNHFLTDVITNIINVAATPLSFWVTKSEWNEFSWVMTGNLIKSKLAHLFKGT